MHVWKVFFSLSRNVNQENSREITEIKMPKYMCTWFFEIEKKDIYPTLCEVGRNKS